MVLFGQHPSQGTLLKASQFLAGELFMRFLGPSTIDSCHATVYMSDELPVRLAHRVKELDELPHNLSEMSSIRKVKNWYAQSFEVGCLNTHASMHAKSSDRFVDEFVTNQATYLQELINVPPISLSPAARQSLFSRPVKNIHLLDSVPNPSLITSYLDGHGAASGTAYGEEVYVGRTGGAYGDNGAGGLRNGNVKLRVPAERRLVYAPYITFLFIISITPSATMHKPRLMFIHLRSTILMPDSPRLWKASNADMTRLSPLSRRGSWSGRGQRELSLAWDWGSQGMGTAEMMYRHGWIGSICRE
jgi:hypothetical protein